MTGPGRPRVLVTGATGNVGGAVVALLAGDPALEVVAAVRRPGERALGVPQVRFDFDDPAAMAGALEGVDRMLMVTGYTVDKLVQGKTFVDAARRAGVRHVVHLGSPGDDDTAVAHYAWEQLVERYLEWSGVGFTHLRPQIFMQNLLGYGNTRIVEGGIVRQYVGAARLCWVDCADVAAVAALCLREPELHRGRTYRLGADVHGYEEVARVMAEVVGQPFSYEARPPEEFRVKATTAGADAAYMRSVHRNYADLGAGIGPGVAQPFDDIARLLDRPPVTLRQFVQAHAESFRY